MRWGYRLLAVGVLAMATSWVWAWSALPDNGIPTHWSGSGPADGYSSKPGLLLGLGALALVVAGGLILLGWVIGRSEHLTGLNVPNRANWAMPQHRDEAVRRLRLAMAGLAGLLLLLVAGIPVVAKAALADPQHRMPGSGAALIGVFLVATAVWVILLLRAFADPDRH